MLKKTNTFKNMMKITNKIYTISFHKPKKFQLNLTYNICSITYETTNYYDNSPVRKDTITSTASKEFYTQLQFNMNFSYYIIHL